MTYCGLATLKLLDKLDILPSRDETVRWLLFRQVSLSADGNDGDKDDDNSAGDVTLTAEQQDMLISGFNGRINKVADTCYSFWTEGSLEILEMLRFSNIAANINFLLELTQHRIGGFGKLPEDFPGTFSFSKMHRLSD